MGIAERQTSQIDLKVYKDLTASKKKLPQTNSNSFEQVYKTSYSHGLEKIYALENVDISTVRTIDSDTSSEKYPSLEEPSSRWIDPISPQLELDLGERFYGSIEPFFLREPLQMLGLSKKIENCLLNDGKKLIQDVLPLGKAALVWPAGLGQGHIDEIHTKLQHYLEGLPFQRTKTINFLSWLKTLISGVTPKKAAIALEHYHIPQVLSLSPLERQEVRRLNQQQRLQWLQEARLECLTPVKILQAQSDMEKIATIFIKPWLEKRFGIATENEICERMLYLSEPGSFAIEVLQWMSQTFFEGNFPLKAYLPSLDKGLFGVDNATKAAYNAIIEVALSYFYKSSLSYSLPKLVLWIARELGRKWQGYATEFIERALRLSPKFRVRKDALGILNVKLS